VDPTHTSPWGFTKRIEELYNLPSKKYEHDHLPSHDAYNIAFDYQVANNISTGIIKLKINSD